MTDATSSPSASGTTSGRPGRRPTDPASEPTSPPPSRTATSLVGPVPCFVCGAPLYWYSDHVWRQFRDDGPHICSGYYAVHRAEHANEYRPLHVRAEDIPPLARRRMFHEAKMKW